MKKILLFSFVVAVLASCNKMNSPKVQKAVDSLKVGLIAYYPLNNSVIDSSGNGHSGTAFNLTATTDRYGKTNGAYQFNGINSYITVPDAPVLRLDSTDFTLNSWIKIDAYNSSYGSIIMAKRGNGAVNGWNLGIAGYGDLTNDVHALGVVTYSESGGNAPFIAGTTVLDTVKWHMVTTVYVAAKHEARIYVDGFLDQLADSLATPNAVTNAPLYIGADYVTGAYFLKGKLDDLRIYNRALTAKQVLALYVLPN